MSANAQRAALLTRALHAALERDYEAIRELCTDDIRAWTPALSIGSRDELVAQLERRDDAFTEFELRTFPLDVGGAFAGVEWTVSMRHSGSLTVGRGTTVEPTGLRVTVAGATVAEFRGSHICAIRQYWDELAVFEQLGLLNEAGGTMPDR